MSKIGKVYRSTAIAAGAVGAWWLKKAESGANVLELRLSGRIVEDVPLSGLAQRFFPAGPLSMREVLSGIGQAAESAEIRALVVKIAAHDLGWGRAMELTEAIKRFRAAGKYALAYLEEPENIDTLIAAACDRVVCPPGAPIYLTGLLSEVMYFKGVLDKLEIRPELFQAGKYKSAVEPYTRSSMSREHREAVESLLDSIYRRWIAAIAESRRLSPERAEELIDGGPWIAEQAREMGLLDDLIYEDQIDDYLEKWLGLAPRRIPLERFHKLFAPRPSVADPWKKPKALALITASGTIHGGESRYYGPGDGSIGADTLRDALDWARQEDSVGAVVVRVDSPGGSATHSDLIWREVERLKAEKPVVVSMGDVAASGGYYIAMPAHHIVASPGALTGSIGVIGGKVNLKGLYEKIGIKKDRVKRGKNSELSTDYGQLSPELKKKLRHEMDTIYHIFVEKAAGGRKMDFARMDEVAQGRVWTGEQAKEIGLVDELGDLMVAIQRAKERAGVAPDRKLPVYLLPKARKFALPMLPFSLPIPGGAAAAAVRELARLEPLANARVLAYMPYLLKIK